MNNAPEAKGKIMAFMVLFVALIEVIAIYGLIVSFQILNNPASITPPDVVVEEVISVE